MTRAVIEALTKGHKTKFIYVDRFDLETEKKSFDLEGNPGDPQAALGVAEEAQNNIHAQKLWPEIIVECQLVEDTPNLGEEHLAYVTEIKNALKAMTVEGWKIEVKPTSPDRNRRFSMTFDIVVPEKKKEES